MATVVTQEGVRAGHVVVPLSPTRGAGAGEDARLSFDNGADRLDLAADHDLEELLEARFAAPLPLVWAAGRTVHVEYPLGARLQPGRKPGTVRLSQRVPWSIDIHGGAAHLRADLADVDVRSIAVHAGAADTALALGRPTGTCTIRLTSVKDLRVRRPAGVPVRVEVARSAQQVTLDDRRFGAVGGALADQTPGYDTADGRYLLIVSGAADTLQILTSEVQPA